KRANPVSSLAGLAQIKGIGLLVAVVGLAGLAQFTLHMTWVLYTDLKFGWGPRETGWSLFAVGVMSALVQGVLMGPLLRRFPPPRPNRPPRPPLHDARQDPDPRFRLPGHAAHRAPRPRGARLLRDPPQRRERRLRARVRAQGDHPVGQPRQHL